MPEFVGDVIMADPADTATATAAKETLEGALQEISQAQGHVSPGLTTPKNIAGSPRTISC